MHEGLQDRAVGWGFNLMPFNAQANHFFALCRCAALTPQWHIHGKR
jgi:hypothetical protein